MFGSNIYAEHSFFQGKNTMMQKTVLSFWLLVMIIIGSRLQDNTNYVIKRSIYFCIFQENLRNNSDVMFGSDYSSVSVPPPDHIGESTPYSYNYQVLLSFVGFDLCVLATSDHTIISYGTSVHIMYFKVEYFLSIRKSFKNKSPFYSKHIFTCRHFQVRLVCGVPCWLEET